MCPLDRDKCKELVKGIQVKKKKKRRRQREEKRKKRRKR